jgi:hypothetical protein
VGTLGAWECYREPRGYTHDRGRGEPSPYRYPFSLNQAIALSTLCRTGVWGMPSSFTALDESQNE